MHAIREYSLDIDGDEFAVFEWNAEAAGTAPPILMLHATGFHSRCWQQVIRHLPDRHVYAIDLRFHGDTRAEGEVDWSLMAEDIGLLLARLELEQVLGVGHSIGGHLIARAAAARPERFCHALLIDPVIMSPADYDQASEAMADLSPRDHPVSRRKNSWRDADEMFRRFSQRHPFCTWQPEVLRDYCDYALRPRDEQEELELACDPVNEASIYLHKLRNRDIITLLPQVTVPVTLMRAAASEAGEEDLSGSPTWEGLAAALPDCRELYLPQYNHFIPMQDPALVARTIEAILANC